MRRLELDFRRTRPASPWAGWLLLALALGFAGDLGVSYFGAREAVARKEARLAGIGQPIPGAPGAGAAARAVSPEEVAFARETIRRLSVPWDDLFGALEATLTDKVALLAIEPDPRSGTVVISGDGRDYVSTLDYVSELERSGVLAQVHLVKHELRASEPQQPVAFSIAASWKEAR